MDNFLGFCKSPDLTLHLSQQQSQTAVRKALSAQDKQPAASPAPGTPPATPAWGRSCNLNYLPKESRALLLERPLRVQGGSEPVSAPGVRRPFQEMGEEVLRPAGRWLRGCSAQWKGKRGRSPTSRERDTALQAGKGKVTGRERMEERKHKSRASSDAVLCVPQGQRGPSGTAGTPLVSEHL